MSFFRLQMMITPFVLFLPLYYVLLPFTHSDYSFWLVWVETKNYQIEICLQTDPFLLGGMS